MSDIFRRLLGGHHDHHYEEDHHRHEDHHHHHDKNGHHSDQYDIYKEAHPYRYKETEAILPSSRMIKCSRCGVSNDVSNKFCYECGDKLKNSPGICPKCNTPVMRNAKFCQRCGTKIT